MNLVKKSQNNKPTTSRSKRFARVLTFVAAFTLVLAMFAVPTFAVEINTNMTTESLVGGIIDFVCTAAMYIGFVIAASGIFMFIMAYKDDNGATRSTLKRRSACLQAV